ncbi:MAG: GTP cyclohydrolase II [Terracidiphilus sp.]|jgi:GTP cyclohydrolase II
MGFVSVKKIAEADFPTRWGAFRIFGFEGVLAASRPRDEAEAQPEQRIVGLPGLPNLSGTHVNGNIYEIKSNEVEGLVALVMGDIHSAPPVVRIHSQCLTGDVFGSLRCDCRLQLELAMRRIAQEGAGILLYEQQEGRGIGLMAKLRAYELQDEGMDTVEANVELGFAADCRAYELPAEVLKLLGVSQVRLITNNPEKVAALESAGIEVTERISAEVKPHESFERYLSTKRQKMGHIQDSLLD